MYDPKIGEVYKADKRYYAYGSILEIVHRNNETVYWLVKDTHTQPHTKGINNHIFEYHDAIKLDSFNRWGRRAGLKLTGHIKPSWEL